MIHRNILCPDPFPRKHIYSIFFYHMPIGGFYTINLFLVDSSYFCSQHFASILPTEVQHLVKVVKFLVMCMLQLSVHCGYSGTLYFIIVHYHIHPFCILLLNCKLLTWCDKVHMHIFSCFLDIKWVPLTVELTCCYTIFAPWTLE